MALTTAPRSGKRRWLFRLGLLVAMAATIELSAWGILSHMQQQAPGYFRLSRAELVEIFREARAAQEERAHDALLGWDYRPGTPDDRAGPSWTMAVDGNGARQNLPFDDAEPALAAYGDSFTAGIDVDDDETWPYLLSRRLGRLVANYGVGGYGTDQALLKFKVKHADRPTPHSVVLAIYEENINRIFNRYRPYYAQRTGVLYGFKPRFVLDDGVLRLIENPMRQPPASEGEFLALAESAREGDLHYQSGVDYAFPFTANLVRLSALVLLKETGIDGYQWGLLPRDPWRHPQASALMRAIIDDFIATAAARGARPVVLFIPSVEASWVDAAGRTPPYSSFVERLRADYAAQPVLVVDVAEATFDAARFNVQPFEGHASAYGNQMIADHVAAAIRHTEP
jgi:hypothetical protein